MPESVPDFRVLFNRLQSEECRYVLIGGLAMIAHGSVRNTFDVDVSIARDRANVDRIVRALAPLKPRPRGFPDELPFVWDVRSLGQMSIATLRTTAGDLDLLSEPEGIDGFEGLWSRAVNLQILDNEVKVASLEDLVAMKRSTGRSKDLEDLRYLEVIIAAKTE